MPNKTIYVSDDDLPLLARAQELTGAALSATIVTALRRLVDVEEGKRGGFDEITVRVGTGRSRRTVRFIGTTLAEFSNSTANGYETYAVYRTSKSRFAVLHSTTEQYSPVGPNAEKTRKWSTGWRGWVGSWSSDQSWLHIPAKAVFTVVDTVDELEGQLPDELFQVVLENVAQDSVIEDLDI